MVKGATVAKATVFSFAGQFWRVGGRLTPGLRFHVFCNRVPAVADRKHKKGRIHHGYIDARR